MPSGAKSPGPARNATVARETGVERIGHPLLDLLEAGTLERREIRIGDEIDPSRPGDDRLEERSRPLEAPVTRRGAGATTLQSGLRREQNRGAFESVSCRFPIAGGALLARFRDERDARRVALDDGPTVGFHGHESQPVAAGVDRQASDAGDALRREVVHRQPTRRTSRSTPPPPNLAP